MNDPWMNFDTVDGENFQRFAGDVGRHAAASYIRKHHITRPPKDEAEALDWARVAVEEYYDET